MVNFHRAFHLTDKRVADVGSGTGFASQILHALGSNVVALDISREMVELAAFIAGKTGENTAHLVADAEFLPLQSDSVDAVVCVGDVLDYLTHDSRAIEEFGRVLRPGGGLLICAGNRINLNLAWMLVSALGVKLGGFDLDPRSLVRHLFPPYPDGVPIEFPHVDRDGRISQLPIRATTYFRMREVMMANRLTIRRVVGVNILPSAVPYHVATNPTSPSVIRGVVRLLGSLDPLLSRFAPFSWFGGHLLVVGSKSPAAT